MMQEKLTFITSNQGKLNELRALLPYVQGHALELPEIQDIDIHKIVEYKLRTALEQCEGPVLVDDTGLYLECFAGPDGKEGLPGPLIKWFLHTTTNVGLAHLALTMGKTRARAVTVLGYADQAGNIQLFEGSVFGSVVVPQGTTGFGWDHIFIPDGHSQTFASMGFERKNQISPRALAAHQLQAYLQGL